MAFISELINYLCMGIAGVFIILLLFVYVKFIEWLESPRIPPPVPLRRSVADSEQTQTISETEPRYVQRLLWEREAYVKNPEILPLLPENLAHKCYTAHGHFNEANLALCLERAFKDIGLGYTRQGDVYRWDVRLPGEISRLDTIMDIRLFREKGGTLTVYFHHYFGYDGMISYNLFDQIARNANLDIVVSMNPLTKVYDDW